MSRFDTDITERLRWDKRYTLGHVPVTLEDAAAEVERLRAEIERLRAFAGSIGRCSCQPGMCDTKHDLQCRAREALDGASNEQNVEETK